MEFIDIKTLLSLRTMFDLDNYAADFRSEIIAGVSIFLASLYIVMAQPAILSETGMPFTAVITATVLATAVSSILMGIYANNPVIVAPAMSVNSMFVYVSVTFTGITWEIALGVLFWSGIIFLLLSILDKNQYFIKTIPRPLRTGVAGGLGLFIAFIGLNHGGFIFNISHLSASNVFSEHNVFLFLIGITIISILMVRQIPGAYIIGIFTVTILSFIVGQNPPDFYFEQSGFNNFFEYPDFSLIGRADILGALVFPCMPFIVLFLVTAYVDNISTLIGLSEASNMLNEEGQPRQADKSLKTIGVGMILSPLVGTSPVTAYVESAVGIIQNGRTGLVAVVAGLCFLPLLFLAPLFSLIPLEATAPVLVISGVVMLWPLAYLRWERLDDIIPFFVSFLMIPFTGSIAFGIMAGSLVWTAIRIGKGRWRRVPVILWIINILAVIYLVFLS